MPVESLINLNLKWVFFWENKLRNLSKELEKTRFKNIRIIPLENKRNELNIIHLKNFLLVFPSKMDWIPLKLKSA